MTITSKFLTKTPASKVAVTLLCIIVLSACSTTQKVETPKVSPSNNEFKAQVDTTANCQEHAQQIANQAEITASPAQYLAAAKTMNNCISNALQNQNINGNYSNVNSSSEQLNLQENIMKMMAVATLNFIKAGDVITAKREVDRFKRVYPNQDLYFTDYTSFLDTATALLSTDSLGAAQISSLNISRNLRDEIERKHYWLNH